VTCVPELYAMIDVIYDSFVEIPCKFKSVSDGGHDVTGEISDSPAVKLEKTHDFSPKAPSPRFKEIQQRLRKLKQLQQCIVLCILGNFCAH